MNRYLFMLVLPKAMFTKYKFIIWDICSSLKFVVSVSICN